MSDLELTNSRLSMGRTSSKLNIFHTLRNAILNFVTFFIVIIKACRNIFDLKNIIKKKVFTLSTGVLTFQNKIFDYKKKIKKDKLT